MPVNEPEKKTPVLYVFFGMIATGKSTLAMAWAKHKQQEYYNSDRVRKELAGITPAESQRHAIDTGIYNEEFSEKTYKALLERAELHLQQGNSVILDASYKYARNRQSVRALAKKLNCQVYFILCQCSEVEMKHRMNTREKDPTAVSDGRWEIYLKQKQRFESPTELSHTELVTIDTKASLADLVEKLDKELS
jgi:predicted kinase